MIRRKPKRGVILPLIAILSVFLVGIVVFFVDVAYMQLARTQLQVATDAAAKAGAEALDGGLTQQQVRQIAIDVAALNEVAGQPLLLRNEDIDLGNSSLTGDGSWDFASNVQPINSVNVVGLKNDSAPSGSVPLFFAGAFGVNSFSPTQTATAAQFKHDVMLVVDRSHSMCFDLTGVDWNYPDGVNTAGNTSLRYCDAPTPGSRWSALYNGVSSFLDICEQTNTSQQQRVGLVTWASEITSCDTTFPAARLEKPLGFDYNAMDSRMVNLGSGEMPGATNMSAGLDEGIAELTGSNSSNFAKKTLILFTDGQWNNGADPATRIGTAKAEKITIHVISLLDGLDPAEMNAIAHQTGGIHYQASTAQELLDAFNALARSLPVALTK